MADKLESLQMLLEGRRKNLVALLAQKNSYSDTNIPNELERQIQFEMKSIAELEIELKNLQADFSPDVSSIAHNYSSNTVVKILFLAANPVDTSQLRLDEEIRAIDLILRQTDFRDRFDIRQHWAVRVIDLQGYLLRHKPDIVHFSGHGSKSSEIILTSSSGSSQPVSTRALGNLFAILKGNIRCVVLNACYSEHQAQAIAEHIDCVVGMSKAVGDKSAISFAAAFYQALGYGKSIKQAFDLGCVQVDLEGLNEQETPRLLCREVNLGHFSFF